MTYAAIIRTSLLGLAYFGMAYASISLGRETGVAAVIWPANALVVGALIAWPPRRSWIDVVAAASANALAHVLAGDAVMNSVVAGVANGLSIGCSLAIYHQWRSRRTADTDVGAALMVVVVAIYGPILGAIVGGAAVGAALSPETPPAYYVGSWWLVEAVATVLILPPFLFWRRRAEGSPGVSPMRGVEFVGALALLGGAASLVPLTGMLWLIELSGAALFWLALRFGIFCTAVVALVFAVGVVVCGLIGIWPHGVSGGAQADMLALQTMVALTALPALLVAAVAAQREKARRELDANARRLSYALEGTNDGLWDWDCVAGRGFFSARAARMFGYDSADEFYAVAGWDRLVHQDDRAAAHAMFDAHINGETPFYEAEIRCRRKDGGWVWVHDRGKVVERDATGRPLRAVGTYTDISERKRLEGALEHLANHDALTGLSNRAVFARELERFTARLDRQGGRLAVLLIDVDHFKTVNDTHGHGAGDALLVAVAARLRIAVRGGDVSARLGGDEFAVISIGHSAGEFDRLAGRLSAMLAEPVPYAGGAIQATVSIGVAVASSAAQAGDELVNRADRALYAAKRDGRGVWRFFAGPDRRLGQAS